MTVDFPDWQVSEHNALAIFNQTVPLNRKAVSLSSNGNLTLPPGNTLIFSAAIDQLAWELTVSVQLPAGMGTVPFMEISTFWADPTNVFTTWNDNYAVAAGNGAFITTYLRGPVKGEHLAMSFVNLDPAVNMTVAYSMSKTSHPYQRDYFRQRAYITQAPIGFNNPSGDPATLCIARVAPNINFGVTVNRLLAAFTGKWKITLDNNTGANPCLLTMADNTGVALAAGQEFYSSLIPAAGVLHDEFEAPNVPVSLALKNTGGAGAITPLCCITSVDY